jgi:hypothetical protein
VLYWLIKITINHHKIKQTDAFKISARDQRVANLHEVTYKLKRIFKRLATLARIIVVFLNGTQIAGFKNQQNK